MGEHLETYVQIEDGLTERSSRARLKHVMERFGPVETCFMASLLNRRKGDKAWVKFQFSHTVDQIIPLSEQGAVVLDGYKLTLGRKGAKGRGKGGRGDDRGGGRDRSRGRGGRSRRDRSRSRSRSRDRRRRRRDSR